MIVSFRHKGLSQLYHDDKSRYLPQDLVERLKILLAALDSAVIIEDLSRPSFHLHALKGDLQGYWSLRVRANWRLIFRFDDGQVFDVDFLDYH